MNALTASLPTSLLNNLRSLVAGLGDNPISALLPTIPGPVRFLILATFILHSPSWPFTWHIRILSSALKPKLRELRMGRLNYINDWKRDLEKKGGMKNYRYRYERLAWFDDCDYRLHLSNSAYPKNADPVELYFGQNMFAPLLTSNAFLAMGARHYNFFKEIPVGARYVIETRCGGWDEKWLYLVSEFIIYPKKRSPKSKPSSNGTKSPNSGSGSGTATPMINGDLSKSRIEEIKKSWMAKRTHRDDGGVVCCLGVSELCIKIGRITIPPRIALWATLQHPSKTEQDRAKAILMSKDHGVSFLKGGWRDEPNAATLGNDIYCDNAEDNWVKEGNESMEMVVRGLSGF
ncbi:hypothetical protein I302_101285 [Kwoniella bestiolae CBS 10118]|uniref:Thioesterase n=1 Tax=Kwoniella bestiolae CBS 10118 TaxID=1296100 RepID=A0A1B9G7G1_9TREE|nr:hypothetical protein I302_04659 [Kwoniella bestiolae CBS 10118]OCF26967.1 hypothetical protein I302_04659 [Kwoniella bestiolae CBS 10118]